MNLILDLATYPLDRPSCGLYAALAAQFRAALDADRIVVQRTSKIVTVLTQP